MEYLPSSYLSLPSKSGVYVFLDKERKILYVGKAKDLKSRVSSYFTNTSLLGEKTKVLVSQIAKIKITIVESELEALLLEAFYIKKFRPKYNIRMTDNKTYLRVRITMSDSYPKILLARREEDKHSVYFGPYPSSSDLKLVLKTIRKAFPYQSVLNHSKRVCLYHHLGLCPCPPIFDSPKLKREYRQNIKRIIEIFEGKSQKIMHELEKERDALSKTERFEEALVLQKRINALSVITRPFHKPFEYDVNPNLRVDIRQQEASELIAALAKAGLYINKLERTECYDISNTQGTHATGSMVVFVNGEKEGSQYRKFKIRRKDGPNDFAMMQEVLTRRFTHDEWNTPDLIIVDGGKGQVSSALIALSQSGMAIPLVGLAKREETIIVPNLVSHFGEERRQSPDSGHALHARMTREENFTEISFPKNSKALHLIMRIRDEAHRFAITYHRKLRSKNALSQEESY